MCSVGNTGIGGFNYDMNNQTVIDTIVKYSKDCIVMRFIKQHHEISLKLNSKIPFPFMVRSANTLQVIIGEIQMCIDERESDIGKLLVPLFEGRDFGHKLSKKHSLTIQEMRDGYITLDGEKFVILLRPLQGATSDLNYSPGVLYVLTSVLEDDLVTMPKVEPRVIAQDIMNLIINNKHKYEYIE
jgi:hypothetical protein